VAQNPRDASERDALDEKARQEESSANAGYFSQWKQTRYVTGNFNRPPPSPPRFDISTGWTFPIKPDGDS